LRLVNRKGNTNIWIRHSGPHTLIGH